jgi:hypothetical protein
LSPLIKTIGSKFRGRLFPFQEFLIAESEDVEVFILSAGSYQVDLFFTGDLKQAK